jgi:signal transduction histidine kinase
VRVVDRMSEATHPGPRTRGTVPDPAPDRLFAGPGEMRALCRAFDWGSTPLGPVSGWSRSLRTAVDIVLGSRNPMFLWWGPGLTQVYNDAYRPSLGGDGRHPRALGMRGKEFWTDIWETIGPQIEQVMTTGEPTWHEDQYLPIERNGRLEDVWWTYSYSPVRDDDGRIAGTLVVCLETTARMAVEHERLRGEEALRESEARYHVLFNSLDQGFCVIEVLFDDGGTAVDYRFVETNPAFVQQTGLANVVGRRIRELAPDQETHWYEMYGKVALTGESARFEAPSAPLNRVYNVYAFRIGQPGEHTVAVLFNDVTAERAAAAEREHLVVALEVERSRLAEVFRRAPSFIVAFHGPDQVYEFVNESYYQLVGHRQILGKPLVEALPEIRDQGFKELLERVRTTGEPWVGRETPVQLQRTPGAPIETRYLDMVFQALADADGTRYGVVAHGSDVTEQVLARREVERLLLESERAREEAETARALAERASRAKGEFLAVMSHELRTPLNAIGGYAELMEMGVRGPISAEQRADLARIQASQRHLLGLINQVLNYTRIETGTVRYDMVSVPVAEALAEAEALVVPQVRARGLTCLVGGCDPALRVRADPEKLQQILLNLLTNAIKFTEPGGEVRVECAARGDRVEIAVRDTGIGIASDKLSQVFEPFVQVDQRLTRQNEGVGLGLAISRDLARGMEGDLAAESEPGVGSRFVLTLPALPV